MLKYLALLLFLANKCCFFVVSDKAWLTLTFTQITFLLIVPIEWFLCQRIGCLNFTIYRNG